jgi:hypothetical protein
MLEKNDFENFIDEAIEICTVFNIWTGYHIPSQNKVIFDKAYSNTDANQCARAFDSSLQHSWILGIARLLDPPETFGHENLSIEFILRQFENAELKQKYEEFCSSHSDFIFSYRQARNKLLAHNAIDDSFNEILKAGIEDFFNFLKDLITEIKKQIITSKDINIDDISSKAKNSVTAFMNLFR